MGVALIAAGALTAGWLATAADSSVSVVVAASPLLRGQVVTEGQLATARVAGLDGLELTPSQELADLVGKTVLVDVPVGVPIPSSAVGAAGLPAPGQAVVGILLAPGQVPSVALRAGARVRIVATPRAQEDPPTQAGPGTAAVLVSTSADDVSGGTVANVSVPQAQAAAVAALAATGRAALVLDADQAGG
jgi:hypothetical protein